MEVAKEKEEPWIIQYSNGQLVSFTGTKEEAEKEAEKEAAGRRWKIV